MPRKRLRRLLAKVRDVRSERSLRVFGALLHNGNLWHLNRTSVAWAVSVGLFMAFVPVPFQMVLAAAAAIVIGCNLPIAVVMVWVSNPLTMTPLFFAAYKLGAWLLEQTPRAVQFEFSFGWLWTKLEDIWQPLLLGCLIMGIASAALGHLLVRLIWRIHVAQSWRERRRRRAARAGGTVSTPPGRATDGAEMAAAERRRSQG